MERFQRQIKLKELGPEGQHKLSAARVLVIGAGGLGCPVLLYLAAAGVGHIGVIDFDKVELSNLHRQVLFSVSDAGALKAERAAARINEMYPDVVCQPYPYALTNQNALDLFVHYDLIVDGSDNFATRYLVNDACVLLGKPLVYGAVSRLEGQVAVFNLPTKNNTSPVNYRRLFPEPPRPGEVLNCEESGVLGVLPGIIGLMQANEAIKIIAGIEPVLSDKLLNFNSKTNQTYTIELSGLPDNTDQAPKDRRAYEKMDYDWFCGHNHDIPLVPVAQLSDWLSDAACLIVDVRQAYELPAIAGGENLVNIPLPDLPAHIGQFARDQRILFVCQSGIRSARAVQILKESAPQLQSYSLEGGVEAWQQYNLALSKPTPNS